ncbi:MAG: response regulator, partial [Paraglaciecola polaris]
FRQAFPKAEMQDQINVINARLMYLADEKDNAKSLLEQLDNEHWENETIEALLDKAKAFHEIGLHSRSQEMLLEIVRRCAESNQSSEIFLRYAEQEQVEKSRIKQSSKELNNSAVQRFQQGDIDNALHTFSDAFTLMPKNPSIALNLLQVITIKRLHGDDTYQKTIRRCVRTVETGPLNDEQESRYTKIRELLDDIV